MTMPAQGPKVAILTVPEVSLGRPVGGAEAIAEQVARGLARSCDVLILHGHGRTREYHDGVRQVGRRLWTCDAFPITPAIRDHGVLSASDIYPHARAALQQCHSLLCFERAIEGITGCRRYAVVGGMCYPHCAECMRSTEWDEVVVPSAFVAEYATRDCAVPLSRVRVIPNGLDPAIFFPQRGITRHDRSYVFLVPGRPDAGKGHEEALAFATLCRNSGYAVSLVGFRQDSFLNSHSFYMRLESLASAVEFEFRPWVPRYSMPAVYRESDLTLCLGSSPEGFGLGAAESIACGTPVVARPQGALKSLVPQKSGMEWCEVKDLASLVGDLPGLLRRLRNSCLDRGAKFVRQFYSEERMIEAYRALVD